MPVPADVQIEYDGTDITDHVLYSSARFEAQASGGVGTFSFGIRDIAQEMSFVTGKEIVLTLDNKRYYAGYLMQNGATFAFPAVDTTSVAAVTTRQFMLQGVNYNVLFDRLISYNHDDILSALDEASASTSVGELVRTLASDHVDVPGAFNVTDQVDNIGPVLPNDTGETFDWLTPGASFRDQMREVTKFYGAIYYFSASKRLHLHAPENVYSRWGFSDRPNNRGVASAATTFTGATYGFREMETSQDITDMANDALVWGGNVFEAETTPSTPSGIVFARRQDSDSIATHGRWQVGENQIGQLKSQAEVNARAGAIVFGGIENTTGADPNGLIRQRTRPNWTVRLAWYAHDVPVLQPAGTTKDHLTPGDIVTIVLYVHGNGLAHPLILTLPLRRVTITFPTLPSNTDGEMKTYVRFDGEFGLSLSDPFSLWEAILNQRKAIRRTVANTGTPDTTGGSGALWGGTPDETPNGTRTTFQLSSDGNPIQYAATTSNVYVNGLLLRQGADYLERPSLGQIIFTSAPPTGATIQVQVRLAG